MDKQSNSTAVPEISTLIIGTTQRAIAHNLTREELQKVSMKELRALIALFDAISETACAYLNQGRFYRNDAESLYNDAGNIGDALLDHLNWCTAMVEQVAKEAMPSTAEEAEHRAWLLIGRAAGYSENLTRFVAAAAQLSVSVMEKERA